MGSGGWVVQRMSEPFQIEGTWQRQNRPVLTGGQRLPSEPPQGQTNAPKSWLQVSRTISEVQESVRRCRTSPHCGKHIYYVPGPLLLIIVPSHPIFFAFIFPSKCTRIQTRHPSSIHKSTPNHIPAFEPHMSPRSVDVIFSTRAKRESVGRRPRREESKRVVVLDVQQHELTTRDKAAVESTFFAIALTGQPPRTIH
jgi:hypothetical protein